MEQIITPLDLFETTYFKLNNYLFKLIKQQNEENQTLLIVKQR